MEVVQVQYSLVDRRPAAQLAPYCAQLNGNGGSGGGTIGILCYGVLCGGFLRDKWLGAPEPTADDEAVPPSARKYLAIIMATGGWERLQRILRGCARVADELSGSLPPGDGADSADGSRVTIAQVALAWALGQAAVKGVIVGAGSGAHVADTRQAEALSARMDAEQRRVVECGLAATVRAPIRTT